MANISDDKLIFNIIDWYDIDDNHDDDNDLYNKKYIIKIFGRTEKGESVYLKVLNFDPHFYILLPDEWNDNIIDTKINKLLHKLRKMKSISMKYFLQSKIISKKKFCRILNEHINIKHWLLSTYLKIIKCTFFCKT